MSPISHIDEREIGVPVTTPGAGTPTSIREQVIATWRRTTDSLDAARREWRQRVGWLTKRWELAYLLQGCTEHVVRWHGCGVRVCMLCHARQVEAAYDSLQDAVAGRTAALEAVVVTYPGPRKADLRRRLLRRGPGAVGWTRPVVRRDKLRIGWRTTAVVLVPAGASGWPEVTRRLGTATDADVAAACLTAFAYPPDWAHALAPRLREAATVAKGFNCWARYGTCRKPYGTAVAATVKAGGLPVQVTVRGKS